jgi:hypothetical protein
MTGSVAGCGSSLARTDDCLKSGGRDRTKPRSWTGPDALTLRCDPRRRLLKWMLGIERRDPTSERLPWGMNLAG